MSVTTYYVVQPFEIGKRGKIVPAEPVMASGEQHAIRTAYRLEPKYAGVVAFSRRGDTTTGDFDEAVVLVQLGSPEAMEQAMAAAA